MQHLKKKKNILSTLWSSPWLISVVLLVALGIQGCGKKAVSEKKADPVRFVKLYTIQDSANLSVQHQFPGLTKASEEANLAFRVAGPLIEFPVKEGQEVKEGDLLARLDPRDYNTAVQRVSASMQGARAQLKAMQAGARPEQMQQLEANVRAREAQVNEVKMRYERQQKLFDDEIISKQQLDGVKAEYDIALAQLEAAEEQLKEGQRGARSEEVEAQQSQIRMLAAQLRDAQSKLSDTELRAPFNGVVARTYVKNFEDIQPKQPILRMQALSQIEIDIDIPESVMAKAGSLGLTLQEGFDTFVEKAVVVFPAHPGREFPVVLKAYETEPDPATQTYLVTMLMEQPKDVKIAPGMNATVQGRISAMPGDTPSLLIPNTAVFADSSGQSSVWVVNPETQRVDLRPVELGNWRGESIEVLDGLQDGDTIAISAVQMLQTGMKVEQMKNLGEL